MLDGIPQTIQKEILRYLLVCEDPIELDPFSPAVSGTIPAGDLSITRVSKHFSHLALVVFYGENCFSLPSTRDPFPPVQDIPPDITCVPGGKYDVIFEPWLTHEYRNPMPDG